MFKGIYTQWVFQLGKVPIERAPDSFESGALRYSVLFLAYREGWLLNEDSLNASGLGLDGVAVG
jgi:hypothetical protein